MWGISAIIFLFFFLSELQERKMDGDKVKKNKQEEENKMRTIIGKENKYELGLSFQVYNLTSICSISKATFLDSEQPRVFIQHEIRSCLSRPNFG